VLPWIVLGFVRPTLSSLFQRQMSLKGYHINAVDEVTQWQIMGATPHISEAWLKPVLESMLAQFPFRIRGFHSDNGSEFINQIPEARCEPAYSYFRP